MSVSELPSWFKPRNYIHFDWPIKSSAFNKISNYVLNPETIAKHSFYPFINYSIKTIKVRKDEHGKIIPKPKIRPISYAGHLDSQIYSYYSFLLSLIYEEKLQKTTASQSILAFRKLGKSNVDFANDAFTEILSLAPCTAIAIDITKFFDSLDHQTLKKAWAELIDQKSLPKDHYNVYKSLTNHCSVDREVLYENLGISKSNPKSKSQRICSPKEFRQLVRSKKLLVVNKDIKGIPQGSPISALLSNIYMFNFDIEISNIIEEVGGKYFRYCDDMLILVKPEFASGVESQINKILRKLKLDVHPDKTDVVHFRKQGGLVTSIGKPLQYLGFTFDGIKILIRSASIAKYTERMRRGIALAKATKRKKDKLKDKHGLIKKPLFKTKIYEQYSHLGRRNFIRYGLRASSSMKSKHIRKQLNSLWEKLQKEIHS